MPLTEARTLLPGRGQRDTASVLPVEPEVDRDALRQLAWDCECFSPIVGLEERDRPESLALDVAGCAEHFGGEQSLAKQIREHFHQERLDVRIGLADSFGAAWAVTHFRTRLSAVCLVPSGEQEQVLRPLPVTALRLPATTAERLQQVGLRTIGQILSLPRSSLPARFGKDLLQRLDQALGTLPEFIHAERRPETLSETWETEHPLFEIALLEQVAEQLLERLLAVLLSRQQGIKQLAWELRDAQGQKTTRTLELLQPTQQRSHLLMLLMLQWEQLHLTTGVQRLVLIAERIESLTRRRQTLWELEAGASSPAIDQLIETLTSRLGRESVSRAVLHADDQPERAYRYESLVSSERSFDPLRMTSHDRPGLTRPLWLKRTPIMVDVMARHRHGPPVRFHWQQRDWIVRHSWGPERITTAWWRGELIRRDYFQVEIEDGRRLWLFRELKTGKWYLHALFD